MDDEFIDRELNRGERGILTPKDREFLLGEADLKSDQAVYNKRSTIRKRVLHGILDLSLILYQMDDRTLAQIFDPKKTEYKDDLSRAMKDGIALFYLETGLGKYDYPIETFDYLLRSGIWTAEGKEGMSAAFLKISVIFEVLKPTGADPEVIAKKISRWDLFEMTEDELRFYLYVQYWNDSQVKPGEKAAEEFLENVERLEDEALREMWEEQSVDHEE